MRLSKYYARRKYGFCAKCGGEKKFVDTFVGDCCVGTPGEYGFCAVGGEPMPEVSRCWVCHDHLARKIPVLV
jgi:hypothetical protein